MKTLALFLIILFVVPAHAQDWNALQKSFSTSYSLETAGKYDGAASEILRVYREDSYEINLRLGWLHYLAGHFNESEGYYQKAIKIAPKALEPLLGIVYPMSAQNKWDEVIKQYQSILLLDPKNTTVNYRMGMIRYNRKEYQSAKNFFSEILTLYPFDYDAAVMLGWCNFQLASYSEAKMLFQKALVARPGDKSATEGLGLIKPNPKSNTREEK